MCAIYHSVLNAVREVDYIFHAAALKQVPYCEFHPMEALKTNVLGTENVLEAAIQCGVKRVICLSTNKAAYPINAMGISKAMMKKVIVAKSRSSNSTVLCITRYGNVLASRGSVEPLFIDQIRAGQPITIADPNMTRFMMTLEDAVDLVVYAFNHGKPGDTFVRKAPAATIGTLGRTKYVEEGEIRISEALDYRSHDATRLDVEGMKALLMRLAFIQGISRGEPAQPED